MRYAFAAVDQVAAAEALVMKVKMVIIYPLVTLMMAFAMLVFIWGLFQYVKNGTEEAARSQGQKHMLWGVIGFVIMLSAVAIFNIALRSFGLSPVH